MAESEGQITVEMEVYKEGRIRIILGVLMFLSFGGSGHLAIIAGSYIDSYAAQLTKVNSSMQAGLQTTTAGGAVMIFTAFYGIFLVAFFPRKITVKIYLVMAVISLLLMTTGFALIFDYFITTLEYLQTSYKEYYGVQDNVTIVWDTIQWSGKCCGFNNYKDWENSTYYVTNDRFLPPSCCNMTDESAKFDCQQGNTSQLFEKGCDGFMTTPYYIIGGLCAGLTVIELLSIILFSCLHQRLYR